MSEQEESLISQLILSIQEQTKAIQSLADSNQILIQAMAEAEGLDEDHHGLAHLGMTGEQ